jgi:hypothetical protein
MRATHCFILLLLSFCTPSFCFSAPSSDLPPIERIEVHPASIELVGRRDLAQLVVTGYTSAGDAIDLTRAAAFAIDKPDVAQIDAGRCMARGDGSATIDVRAAGRSAKVTVKVRETGRPDPVRFRTEVLAVLTKQGCNAGSCHGAPEGKGSLALSMLAYKPSLDEESLVQGGLARRIEPNAPMESLLLKKPLLRVTHVGGKKLRPTDVAFHTLHDWIAEGAKLDPTSAPRATGIRVHPGPARTLRAPHAVQQLAVTAQFSDGSSCDVTRIAMYTTSNAEVLSVDADGLVTGGTRGLAAITVRYLDFVESVYFTIVRPVDGFEQAWREPPEHNFIDQHVNRQLKLLQFTPSDLCGDATFVRRVHLDLTGLLPTADEAAAFLADPAKDKRARLIDRLLVTEEFARFWASKEADLFRVSKTLMKDGRAELFNDWIVDAFRRNLPFDRFVRELLLATGDAHEVGPTNYFMAIPKTEDIAETTAQIFMGSRINCAKCHNHPFEAWTQDDYYRITAVFARIDSAGDRLSLAKGGEARHPATGAVMKPWGAEAVEPVSLKTDDRREVFVHWLTKRGNPFFARVEANRIWSHLLGRGIVHPVDDFRSSNPPANPALLDALADEFERTGLDRKQLIRLICNSHTYQRSATTTPLNADDTTLFSHALPRRLTAEQLHDALGYAGRYLAPATDVPGDIAKLEQQRAERCAKLESEQAAWEKQQRARIESLPLWGGVWHVAGPIATKDFNEAIKSEHLKPESVDLSKAEPARWLPQIDWRDDMEHPLASSPGVTYAFRELHLREAGDALLELEATDAVTVWIDGKSVYEYQKQRAFNRSQQKLKVELPAGTSTLLIKLSHGEKEPKFRARFTQWKGKGLARLDVPYDVAEKLSESDQPLTGSLRERALAHRIATDGEVRKLDETLTNRRQRLDYYTQRPYPERSQFTDAFGQPRRETACACERTSDPTIDQALALLNGSDVDRASSAGATRYESVADNHELVTTICLAAYARQPTEQERQSMTKHLAGAKGRREAIRDLLWVIFNTQEFLFQH